MLFIVGIIVAALLICLLGLLAIGVVDAIVAWFLLKWLVIFSALGGGILGFMIFGTQEAGLGGALLGLVLSVGGLALMAHRAEARERAERLAKVEAERLAREEKIHRAAERRQQRYETLTQNPLGRFVKRLLD